MNIIKRNTFNMQEHERNGEAKGKEKRRHAFATNGVIDVNGRDV